MKNEIGLTPATRKLLENKPPEFVLPPRDKEYQRSRVNHMRETLRVIEGSQQ